MGSKQISIIVVSGTRERLQMAAMIAAVGAVSGNEVSVFLSMNALEHFIKANEQPARVEGDFGKRLEDKKAPGYRSLFEQAVELGDAKIYPCSMAMDVLALEREALEPWLSEPLGLTKYLDGTSDAQVWSF